MIWYHPWDPVKPLFTHPTFSKWISKISGSGLPLSFCVRPLKKCLVKVNLHKRTLLSFPAFRTLPDSERVNCPFASCRALRMNDSGIETYLKNLYLICAPELSKSIYEKLRESPRLLSLSLCLSRLQREKLSDSRPQAIGRISIFL